MQRLAKQVVEPSKINFGRWQNGAVIGVKDLTAEFNSHYDCPYYVVHQAHLHTALYEQAVALIVKTRPNSKVAEYDSDTATINLSDGSTSREILSLLLIVARPGTPNCLTSG